MFRSLLSISAAVALFATFTVSSVQAATVTLEGPFKLLDVINSVEQDAVPNNGELVAGDLKFSNFSYSANAEFDQDPFISTIQDMDGWYGVRLNGDFNAFDGEFDGGDDGDALFTYQVMVLDDGPAITDIHIDSDANIIEEGRGATGGTVQLSNGVDLTFEYVRAGDLVVENPDVWAEFDPTDIVGVTVDIYGEPDPLSNLSVIDFTFSRGDGPDGGPEVPTPAALPAGLALMMFAATRRRRKLA